MRTTPCKAISRCIEARDAVHERAWGDPAERLEWQTIGVECTVADRPERPMATQMR